LAHLTIGGPTKGFLAVNCQVQHSGKLLQSIQLSDSIVWVPGVGLPIINVGQHPDVRQLSTHPAGKDMIDQQHAKDTQTTPFSKSSGSMETSGVGVTHFEMPAHASQGPSPSRCHLMWNSNQNGKAQRWVTGDAIEAFLNVSRHST
jgi:hypothetical protein